MHAALRYDDIAAAGPAARPLEFPTPTVYRCERVDICARDHRSGTLHHLKNAIVRSERDNFGRPAEVAYLVKKKLSKSVYGSVRLCIVLRRRKKVRENQPNESREDSSGDQWTSNEFEWESTELQVVIKASAWSRIHGLRGRHLEDPIKEISAMQLLGNYNKHVLGALEVLQDDMFLYTVMKYVPGGDLYGRLLGDCQARTASRETGEGLYGFDEKQARFWFRQLLLVSCSAPFSLLYIVETHCAIDL